MQLAAPPFISAEYAQAILSDQTLNFGIADYLRKKAVLRILSTKI
jgi:hypothetical protein